MARRAERYAAAIKAYGYANMLILAAGGCGSCSVMRGEVLLLSFFLTKELVPFFSSRTLGVISPTVSPMCVIDLKRHFHTCNAHQFGGSLLGLSLVWVALCREVRARLKVLLPLASV